jgi:hypothetical protein
MKKPAGTWRGRAQLERSLVGLTGINGPAPSNCSSLSRIVWPGDGRKTPSGDRRLRGALDGRAGGAHALPRRRLGLTGRGSARTWRCGVELDRGRAAARAVETRARAGASRARWIVAAIGGSEPEPVRRPRRRRARAGGRRPGDGGWALVRRQHRASASNAASEARRFVSARWSGRHLLESAGGRLRAASDGSAEAGPTNRALPAPHRAQPVPSPGGSTPGRCEWRSYCRPSDQVGDGVGRCMA